MFGLTKGCFRDSLLSCSSITDQPCGSAKELRRGDNGLHPTFCEYFLRTVPADGHASDSGTCDAEVSDEHDPYRPRSSTRRRAAPEAAHAQHEGRQDLSGKPSHSRAVLLIPSSQ